MKFEKVLFLSLLLICTIFMSLIFATILKMNIFDKNQLGFQYLIFSILASFCYFSFKYLKKFDSIIIVFFLAIIYAIILNKTNLSERLGGLLGLGLYTISLFTGFALIFRLCWFNIKHIRNILFSILASIIYMFVHLITSLIVKIDITAVLVLSYFKNALLIMIVISFGITIAELAFNGITKFFKPPTLPNNSQDS
ncbi:MAG: hypothetical protein KAS49_01425 [Candidatus Cloacimonetes bacterium]|nr:hypothetical protein [Candidatus Cloacimonadota bacterium]